MKTALAEFHPDSVTVVGHSAGGAVALLDAVLLSAQPYVDVAVNAITFGMPRVGNKAFADLVDQRIKLVRIINKEDFIPTLPLPRFGYHHPSGEIRILESGVWVSCPGSLIFFVGPLLCTFAFSNVNSRHFQSMYHRRSRGRVLERQPLGPLWAILWCGDDLP